MKTYTDPAPAPNPPPTCICCGQPADPTLPSADLDLCTDCFNQLSEPWPEESGEPPF